MGAPGSGCVFKAVSYLVSRLLWSVWANTVTAGKGVFKRRKEERTKQSQYLDEQGA